MQAQDHEVLGRCAGRSVLWCRHEAEEGIVVRITEDDATCGVELLEPGNPVTNESFANALALNVRLNGDPRPNAYQPEDESSETAGEKAT